MKSTSSSALFSTISNDDVYNISLFLTPLDIIQIESTCKSAKLMVESYWAVYANKRLIDYYTVDCDDVYNDNYSSNDDDDDFSDFQIENEYENIINTINKKIIKLEFSFQNAQAAKKFVLQIYGFVKRIYRNPTIPCNSSQRLQHEQQRLKQRQLKEQFQQHKQLKQKLIKNYSAIHEYIQ